jgi:hypothetical protein
MDKESHSPWQVMHFALHLQQKKDLLARRDDESCSQFALYHQDLHLKKDDGIVGQW